jgi:hypothetical protein
MINKKRSLKLGNACFRYLLTFFLFLIGIFSIYFVFAANGGNWTINGDRVYMDDEYVYLSSNPHTITSPGWVYFNLTSKQFSGEIDAVWGFNDSNIKPKKAELFKPHEVNWTTQHSRFFLNVSNMNVSTEPCDYGNEYNTYKRNATYQICGEWNESGMGRCLYYNITSSVVCFDSYEPTPFIPNLNYTIYWGTNNSRIDNWVDFTSTLTRRDYDFQGMNVWYYIRNVNITENESYQIRSYIDMPIGFTKTSGKYFWAVKRSSDTIEDAISNNRFYYLDPWFNSSWTYRKNITIDSANIDATLTNFPVLINITDSDLITDAQDDGDDIVFTNLTGSKLDHEIEYFDNSTGWLIAWVRIPSLSSSSNTTIQMYYNNSDASNQQNSTGVWDSNFLGVWHLGEVSGGPYADSTSNGLNSTAGTMPDQITGKIGSGQDFADASSEYISFGDVAEPGLNNMTISFWAYPDQNDYGEIIGKRGGSGGGYRVYASGSDIISQMHDGTNSTASDTTGDVFSNSTLWYYVVARFNKDATDGVDIYINNTKNTGREDDPTNVSDPNTTKHLAFGSRQGDDPGSYWDGILDEVRISNTLRSVAWIKFEYYNMNEGDNEIELGSEESGGDNAPKWFDNSTNSTLAGTYIEHRVRWTDTALAGYIFSFDNGTGTFTNDSWVSMTGTNNWSNVSKIVNSTVGSTIRWRVYANDTASPTNLNATDIFVYNTTSLGNLNISISLPTDNTNVSQNSTFTINATITCSGDTGALCGNVTALARYNVSGATPDTAINITQGATPFYINFTPIQEWNVTDANGYQAYGVAVDSNGNMYVTGRSDSNDYYTVKYNASDGTELWNVTDTTGYAAYGGVAVDSNGDVYVTGQSDSNDYYTVKYNAGDGSQLWNATDDNGYQAHGVAVDSNGDVYVTGFTVSFNVYYTVKYNASDGTELWNVTDTNGDIAESVAVDSNGDVYVTGRGSSNYYTVKYNASDGTELWNVTDTNGYQAYDVAIDSNGSVYMAGRDSSFDYYTVKYNTSDSSQLWNVTDTNGYQAYGVAVDSNGYVYVTGQSDLNDSFTVKYNASDGTELWNVTDTNGYDTRGIAIDSSEVYVTGRDGSFDYYTMKYSQVRNPKTSPQTLEEGENFIVSWVVNATGPPTAYEIDVLFNSTTYYPDITENDTEDRTVIITTGVDTDSPLAYLESPANNTVNTTDNTPDFAFNTTDETASTLDCTLWLDNGTEIAYGNNASVLNTTSTTITANSSLSNDDYWWWVNCSDGTNTNISEKWNISINVIGNTYYVDATNGNDSNDGLSEVNAWQTWNKVRGETYSAGDTIKFKRNETWSIGANEYWTISEDGTAANYITIDAYGSGNKPIWDAEEELSGSTWTEETGEGSNIWSTTSTTEVKRTRLDGQDSYPATSAANIDGNTYLWYWGSSKIYIYSTQNPNSEYTNIKVTKTSHFIIRFSNSHYIKIRNIELHGGERTIFFQNGASYNEDNIIIEYNDIWYFYQAIISDKDAGGTANNITLRYNDIDTKLNLINKSVPYSQRGVYDTVKVEHNGDDWHIHNNNLSNSGHSILSIRSAASASQGVNNNIVEYNTFTSPESVYSRAVDIWGPSGKATNNIFRYNILKNNNVRSQFGGENTQIYYNLIYNTTDNPATDYSDNSEGVYLDIIGSGICDGVKVYNNVFYSIYNEAIAISDCDNAVVKNNICIEAGEGGDKLNICIYLSGSLGTGNVIEYNDFYDANTSDVVNYQGSVETVAYADANRAEFSDNIAADPLLVDASNVDFHLQANSPAIDNGTDVNLTQDYEGNSIPQDGDGNGTAEYDIGAYEYTSNNLTVTLESPSNGTSTSNTTITFNCSTVDNAMLSNITLYGNWSAGWHANETVNISGTSNSTTFTKNLIDGSYVWNCLAYDNDSNSDWGNSNYTLTIDTTAPLVYLESPANNTVNTTDNTPDFVLLQLLMEIMQVF